MAQGQLRLGGMNATSTRNWLWKTECQDFIARNEAFKVQDVSRPEEEEFCETLTGRHKLKMEREGHTLFFTVPL